MTYYNGLGSHSPIENRKFISKKRKNKYVNYTPNCRSFFNSKRLSLCAAKLETLDLNTIKTHLPVPFFEIRIGKNKIFYLLRIIRT